MIIHEVEQNSDEWLTLRCGIPTSSKGSELVTSVGAPSKSMKDYAAMLAGEIYAGGMIDDFAGTSYTERGHEFEDEAISYYSFVNDIDVDIVGFVTTDDKLAGSSPDGMVGKDGLVEVKCLGYKAHIKALVDFNKTGKIPTKYVAQVQDQMLICEREWNDSIFYHPKLPTIIVRNEPLPELVKGLLEQKELLFIERDRVLDILRSV